MKKVAVLTGSRRKNGTSFLLADRFIEGVKASGNEVVRFDTAFLKVAGCTGCNRCRAAGACIYRDDFGRIIEAVKEADVVVFVTPVYYYGMTAWLKAVIERFHSVSGALVQPSKRSVLISTCADSNADTVKPLVMQYEYIRDYLQWQNAGVLTALGVPEREVLLRSGYPEMAKKLGEAI